MNNFRKFEKIAVRQIALSTLRPQITASWQLSSAPIVVSETQKYLLVTTYLVHIMGPHSQEDSDISLEGHTFHHSYISHHIALWKKNWLILMLIMGTTTRTTTTTKTTAITTLSDIIKNINIIIIIATIIITMIFTPPSPSSLPTPPSSSSSSPLPCSPSKRVYDLRCGRLYYAVWISSQECPLIIWLK